MLIRGKQPGEEDAISCVYALSWKTGYRGIVPNSYLDALPLNRWTPILKESAYSSLVAEVDGQLVGTVCTTPARDETMQGWGELVSCYVLPEHWSRGVGGALLQAGIEELRRGGFHQIYLWVLEQNVRARAFYEKHGFSKRGETAVFELDGNELTELRYVLFLEEKKEKDER